MLAATQNTKQLSNSSGAAALRLPAERPEGQTLSQRHPVFASVLNTDAQMLILLMLLATHTFCLESSVVLEDDSVLEVGRADFHAYENAWSVLFTHALDVHAFDLLVFEACQPPCDERGSAEAQLYTCRALARAFAQPGWRNEYMAGRVNESLQLCADLSGDSAALQAQAGRVLSDAQGLPLVRVRAPLALVLFNEDELATRWASVVQGRDDARPDILSVAVRVSYITVLHRVFSMRRSVLRIELRRPVRSALSFGVQNPCTAAGFSAPEFGVVSLVNASGRLLCAWFCREDMVKVPYNSVPPTRAQLNASSPEHALLPVKYACLAPPAEWVATVFGLTLETNMLPAETYAQTLYDAVDRLAAAVRRTLLGEGDGIVLLAVASALYHPVPFDEWAQRLRAASCTSADCGALEEISNPSYVYARRRLLAEELQNLRVEGVLIAPEAPAAAPQRVEALQELRAALSSAIASNIELVAEADASLLVRSVQDVDVAKVILATAPPDAVVASAEDDILAVLRGASVAGAVLLLLFVLAFLQARR